ncbi:predicted protein, partial [Nematostella vectensis]
ARVLFFPSLLWIVATESRSRRWFDRIDSTVILGALPFKSQTQKLIDENVKGVITLNEEFETKHLCNSKQEWFAWGVTQLRLATVDFGNAPSFAQLLEGVKFIEDMRSKGDSVYVHCKAGRGRSTTLVACYLMKNKNLNPEEAHLFIKSKRPQIRLASQQWIALQQFHDHLHQKKNS